MRVVIADADSVFRRSLNALLSGVGHVVEDAADGGGHRGRCRRRCR